VCVCVHRNVIRRMCSDSSRTVNGREMSEVVTQEHRIFKHGGGVRGSSRDRHE